MSKVKKEQKEKQNVVVKTILDIINGNFLGKDKVVQTLPYLIFLTFLVICYIGNGYYAEKSVRAIDSLEGELRELNSEYITLKSDLMVKSKQSEVARSVEALNLQESVTPPKKIVIDGNE
ncbi:MAG: hypothetical protein HRT72_02470 [Flavobacteriales bacterium]|nr:hypothetical protein [Flavobacteriales bacterium]